MSQRNQLQSVELFAGGGGMAIGMRNAGFEHQALVEWWKPAAKVLRHNAELKPELWKPDKVIEQDVRETFEALSQCGPVHLVAGGPPCQPFSFAGAHAGFSDVRNMFPAAIEVVRRLGPEIVIFENVPGLTRPSFAPYLDYVREQLRRPHIAPRDVDELWSDHYNRLHDQNDGATYRVYQDEVNAADLGVPQTRRRIFIVAIRSDVAGADTWEGIKRTHSRDVLLRDQWITKEYWERHELPVPEEPPTALAGHVERIKRIDAPVDLDPWITLRDALVEVPEPYLKQPDDSEWPNHIAIPGARVYPKHTGSPLDLPSKTIKAGVHGVSGGEAMLRELDGTVRYLTVRESALVQGFPQGYEFPGPRSRVMGVIGNAVAVKVAEVLGNELRQHTGL